MSFTPDTIFSTRPQSALSIPVTTYNNVMTNSISFEYDDIPLMYHKLDMLISEELISTSMSWDEFMIKHIAGRPNYREFYDLWKLNFSLLTIGYRMPEDGKPVVLTVKDVIDVLCPEHHTTLIQSIMSLGWFTGVKDNILDEVEYLLMSNKCNFEDIYMYLLNTMIDIRMVTPLDSNFARVSYGYKNNLNQLFLQHVEECITNIINNVIFDVTLEIVGCLKQQIPTFDTQVLQSPEVSITIYR